MRPSQGALGRAARQPESALHMLVRKLARDILSKKKRNAGQRVCYDALVCFTRKPDRVPGAFPVCVEEHTSLMGGEGDSLDGAVCPAPLAFFAAENEQMK